jgi:phage terminase large subunit
MSGTKTLLTPSSQTNNSWELFSVLTKEQKERIAAAAMPDHWVTRTTGEKLWKKQTEIARAVVTKPRVAVASCNSAGKSYLAARVAIWFLKTYTPAIVLTTAPTDRQVRRILWKEIAIAYHKAEAAGNPLGGTLLTKEWQIADDHFAFGFATRDYDATSFQGIHAPHLLVIADEAAGLTETIWEGIYSVLKGAHTRLLAIGNPTSMDGQFYKAFSSDRWWTTNISAFDTPNLQGQGIVIPGLVTAQDVEDAKEDWGEGSPLYVSRVEGKFPESTIDTLIPPMLLEQAGQGEWTQEEMDEVDPDEPVDVGADFARYGTDKNVFVARRGRLGLAAEEFGREALGRTGIMAAAGRLVNFALAVKAKRIKCDAVGLGGGVPDRLRELQDQGLFPRDVQIIDINAGGRPMNPSKYADLATEQWDGLASRLRKDLAFGPIFKNKRAAFQLTRRKYKVQSDGRMKLESKDDMKKRGLDSPDWGDAITSAYAEYTVTRRKIRARSV